MKRRGFLGSVLGLFAVPAVAKLPIAIVASPEPAIDLDAAAYRACNPPIIVDGEFIRMYRDEFIAGFESKQALLREIVTPPQ